MFGSEVIDAAIGMALLFLFMSLIASAIREAIENVIQTRAGDLERGIMQLLHQADAADAPAAPAASSKSTEFTTKDLYEHPLILSLYKGRYSPNGKRLPAYIPRQSFARAVLDLVAQATENGKPLSIEALRTSLEKVDKPNPVQRVVLTALGTAGNDLSKVQHAIEEWYDASMDRVSGWYTKRTARILLAIGFLSAALLNVDALTVAQHLITDKTLRLAVVAQADSLLKANPTGPAQGQKPPSPAKDAAAPADPAAGGTDASADGNKPLSGFAAVTRLKEQLADIGFPIGWTVIDWVPYPIHQACTGNEQATKSGVEVPAAARVKSTLLAATVANEHYECRQYYSLLLPLLLGWIGTGLAVMLGAPFWFDVLNKFMIVRSTIKPKEKSPDEAPPTASRSPGTPTSRRHPL